MNQSKTNKSIAILLALVMFTSIFASETLSRFVTEVNSSDNARIAYWGINEGPVTMDLFDGEYFYNDDENGVVLARSHDGDNIIAPGFGKQSQFGILVHESTITPEVAYELKITLDDSEIDELIKDNTSIQWKLNNGAWGTFDQLKSSLLALSGDPSGYKIYQPGELIQNFRQGEVNTIAWQWIDDPANDAADTELTDYVDFDKANVKLEVTISAVQYLGTSSMLNATSSFNINDENAVLSFRSAAPVGELQEVKVDGNVVAPENYEVIEGSTIIKFNDSYARLLSVGNHIVEIVSQKMTAKTNFKIVEEYVPIVHNGIIPEGGIYYRGIVKDTTGNYEDYDWTPFTVYETGSEFPEPEIGDIYVYGDYEYRYGMTLNYSGIWTEFRYEYPSYSLLDGWGVDVRTSNKVKYDNILATIAGKDVVSAANAFSNCRNMIKAPGIPDTVKIVDYIFHGCSSLTDITNIPKEVSSLHAMFSQCKSLKESPEIPFGIKDISSMFVGCTSLIKAPVIPNSVIDMGDTFNGCTSLVTAPVIPSSVIGLGLTFNGCTSLKGEVEINSNPNFYISAFGGTKEFIILTGDSNLLNEIAETSENSNIRLKSSLPDNDGEINNTLNHNNKIPKNGMYYVGIVTDTVGVYHNYGGSNFKFYLPGEDFPETPSTGDIYVYGDYEYRYNMGINENGWWTINEEQNGWGVAALDKTKSEYGDILNIINGKNIVNMSGTFYDCNLLITSPVIPETVKYMNFTFYNCENLETVFGISNNVVYMESTFENCLSLTEFLKLPDSVTNIARTFRNSGLIQAPIIPYGVENMEGTFSDCTSLVNAPVIPETVKNMGDTFNGCTSLETASTIPSDVEILVLAFAGCTNLTGTIEINANPKFAMGIFSETFKPITLTGSSTMLNEIAADYSNVTVK